MDEKIKLEERIMYNLNLCKTVGDKTSQEFHKYFTEVRSLSLQYFQTYNQYFKIEEKQ